jgi:hypothetical protein
MKLVERVKNILLQPKTEWTVIEPEATDAKALYLNYVAIVAIIPAAASFLSLVLFTSPFGMRAGIGWALMGALAQYVLTLVMVFADVLAPSFDGRKNLNQALKLTAYAMTAAWVAAVFVIIPGVGWLVVLLGTLYSLYLFFLGTQVMMKVPEQKAVGYTIVVVVAAIIVSFVIAMFQAAMLGGGAGGMMGTMPHF